MSDFQRCLCRNFAIGLLAAFLCYLCYSPILSDLAHEHAAFSYALLASSCNTCFCVGFSIYYSDNDPPLFKYLAEGARLTLPLTALSAFVGLTLFHWWGLGVSFVTGIWASIVIVRLIGPEKPVDRDNNDKNYFYSMVDYYSRGMRIPSAVIPPLALLGVFLFQWWGLGAGIIMGGLISALGLGLWGPTKPSMHVLAPTQPPQLTTDSRPSSAAKHQQTNSTSIMVPPPPTHIPIVTFTQSIKIQQVDKSALFLSKSI